VYGGPSPESVNMERSTDIVEQVGMYLFALYHVVIIIVLINMLIAMMSHSFEDIQVSIQLFIE
jgi:ABC-type polysaccharide/polyol phosphate export permease